MIAYDHSTLPEGKHAYCAYAGRRDGKNFVLSHEQIVEKYSEGMKMMGRIPDVLSGAMGNQMYIAIFDTKREMDSFYKNVLKCNK